MKNANKILQIPIFKTQQSQQDTTINGLVSTIASFKDVLLERINRIESKLEKLEQKEIPDNSKDLSGIKKDIKNLNSLYEKIDTCTRESIQTISNHTSEVVSNQVDINKAILETIADTSFKANYELFDNMMMTTVIK
jgi:hypothetical protein